MWPGAEEMAAGWPRSGWAASHRVGRAGRASSAPRQRGRRGVTVAGPASLGHGHSCGQGLGGGGGGPDTSTSGDGSCPGCQEDVLILLYARSEPSVPKAKVRGVRRTCPGGALWSPLWSRTHGHVTSSPADARDKAGRIPKPRARPAMPVIPLQHRLGPAEGPPCSTGEATEIRVAILRPALMGEEAAAGLFQLQEAAGTPTLIHTHRHSQKWPLRGLRASVRLRTAQQPGPTQVILRELWQRRQGAGARIPPDEPFSSWQNGEGSTGDMQGPRRA